MTYVKCLDCGFRKQKIGSLKEMGMLNDKDCPNCEGELILVDDEFTEMK